MKAVALTTLVQSGTKRWHVVDDTGWSLMSFRKPRNARKARNLYRAYMWVSDDVQADDIMLKIQRLHLED